MLELVTRPISRLFRLILENPKTRIGKLAMRDTDDPLTTSLRNFLSFRQIRVRFFALELGVEADRISKSQVQYQAMAVLPYLKPGVLKSIQFSWEVEDPVDVHITLPEMIIEELVELEQWKKAKNFVCHYPVQKLLDSFTHFHQMSIVFKQIEPADVIRLRDMFINSLHFIYCELRAGMIFEEVLEEMGVKDHKNTVTFGTLKIEVFSYVVIFKRVSQD